MNTILPTPVEEGTEVVLTLRREGTRSYVTGEDGAGEKFGAYFDPDEVPPTLPFMDESEGVYVLVAQACSFVIEVLGGDPKVVGYDMTPRLEAHIEIEKGRVEKGGLDEDDLRRLLDR